MTKRSFNPRPLWLLVVALSCVVATLALAAGMQRDAAYRYLKVFQEVWSLTEASYVEPVEEADLLEGAYRGMLSTVDAASGYLTAEDVLTLRQPVGPAGAGMEVLPSGGTFVVVRVDEDGPAHAADLAPGDQIWRIEDRPVRDAPWPLVHRWIHGKAGESLRLAVLDGKNFKLREVTLTLAEPADPGFQVETLEGDIVRLRLLDLDRVDPQELVRAVREKVSGGAPLLIDLRGAVSLSTDGAVRLGSQLAPAGPLFELVDAEGRVASLAGTGSAGMSLSERPVYVLVDSTTAGMTEGLAAMLRDRLGARICGRSTYGLAGVPELIELSSGAQVLLTTRQARVAGTESWAGSGLEPDKQLSAARPKPAGEPDSMLEEAADWIRSGAAPGEKDVEQAPAA